MYRNEHNASFLPALIRAKPRSNPPFGVLRHGTLDPWPGAWNGVIRLHKHIDAWFTFLAFLRDHGSIVLINCEFLCTFQG